MSRLGVAAVMAAMTLAGCGVSGDSEPRTLSRDDVPFELLAPGTTSTSTTAPVAATTRVPIFLVGAGNRLAPVVREVQAPPTLAGVLESLLAGPNGPESAAGIRSAISNQTRLLDVSVEGRVATIDLSEGFAGIGGQEQILALAQLVFTAIELRQVDAVRFTLDGALVQVPRGDGTLTQLPLRRDDFASFAPA